MRADHSAGSSLGDPEPLLQMPSGPATTVRGQKFPSASSARSSAAVRSCTLKPLGGLSTFDFRCWEPYLDRAWIRSDV